MEQQTTEASFMEGQDLTVGNIPKQLWSLAGYGFLAAMMVEASSFQAIGQSWPGFWIFVLRFGVVSIPLAYVLTQVFTLPIVAIWFAGF